MTLLPDDGRMKTLADTVVLEGKVQPDDVRDCLIDAVNLAWHTAGNDGRASVPANFVAWALQENERLRALLLRHHRYHLSHREADEYRESMLYEETRVACGQ